LWPLEHRDSGLQYSSAMLIPRRESPHLFEFRLSRLRLQRKQILLQVEKEEDDDDKEEGDDDDSKRMALIYFLSSEIAVEYVAFLLLIPEAQFRIPAERQASLNEEFCGFPCKMFIYIQQKLSEQN
jgi:hypothetical protein